MWGCGDGWQSVAFQPFSVDSGRRGGLGRNLTESLRLESEYFDSKLPMSGNEYRILVTGATGVVVRIPSPAFLRVSDAVVRLESGVFGSRRA